MSNVQTNPNPKPIDVPPKPESAQPEQFGQRDAEEVLAYISAHKAEFRAFLQCMGALGRATKSKVNMVKLAELANDVVKYCDNVARHAPQNYTFDSSTPFVGMNGRQVLGVLRGDHCSALELIAKC